MGLNWQVNKHASVRDMVMAFQRSCEEQVEGFFAFVEKNSLVNDDYSGKLIKALKMVNTLKQDGAKFEA